MLHDKSVANNNNNNNFVSAHAQYVGVSASVRRRQQRVPFMSASGPKNTKKMRDTRLEFCANFVATGNAILGSLLVQ